jgi:monofunctional biosynthetic peptidoglycan transglycosylase
MDKNNKVLLSIFWAFLVLMGGLFAFVLDAFLRVPDFNEMRSKVVVPIKLADKSWVEREMGPKTAGWVATKQISNPMFMAVIASEDTSFFSHQGVDYHELRESIKKDWEEKRWARGGSTLTQQVVKNVYLSREKSLWRKFKELVWAREIEKVLSKTEILTFYLNMAEWGPSLYGIKGAASHYFGILPSEITPKQAAFLAMLLPSPIKYHSYFVKKELTPFSKRRVGKILRIMNRMGYLEDDQYQTALQEKLWGVTGELPVYREDETEPSEESDSGIVLDVLAEPNSKSKVIQPPSTEVEASQPQSEPPVEDVLEEPALKKTGPREGIDAFLK